MTAQQILSFRQLFDAGLTANDQDFALHIEHISRFLFFAVASKDSKPPLPPGSTLEQELVKASADTSFRNFGSRLSMVAMPEGAEIAPNNTGIRLVLPTHKNGASIASAGMASSVTLTEGMCTSCSGPAAAAHHRSCADLSDPAQVRGGQLGRMMVALHEMGHNAFSTYVLSSDMSESAKRAALNDQRLNETMSDTTAALLMIKTLGREGLTFVKQYAAGFRDGTNGYDNDHNTANALAMLIDVAEADITTVTSLPHQAIYKAAYETARLATPTNEQVRSLEAAFQKAGIDTDSDNHAKSSAHARATTRLEWYDTQRKDEQAGKPVNKEALDLYEKFMRYGDKAMMTPQQLQENLHVMVDLGPLKGNMTWQEQARADELSCRATPPTTPLTKPPTAQP